MASINVDHSSSGGAPVKPEWIRLLAPINRCRYTGLSRSTLNELVTPCEANGYNPPVHSVVLKKRGTIRLLGAMRGQLGLDMAREHHPDLILLDLQLPDAPGDEWLRQLKADEQLRKIPVIMVTADATKGQNQRLLGLGARAYLTKPLHIRAFLQSIDEALSGQAVAQVGSSNK